MASTERLPGGSARRVALALGALWILSGCGGPGAASSQSSTPEAVPELPEPAAPKPRASAQVREAEQALAAQDYDTARAKFEQALEQDPDDARAHLGLGLTLEALGDAEGAEQAYRAALEADPELAEAWNNLALLLRDAGRDEEAIAALRKAVAADPELPSAHANLALALEDAGDLNAAHTEYERALHLAPEQTLVRVNYGLLLLKTGDQAAAARELHTAWETADGNRAALAAIGNGLRRAGEATDATRALQQALDAGDEPTPALLSELALAHHAAGQSGAAVAVLQKAVALDPGYATAHYLLGGIAAAQGDFKTARGAYEAFLKLQPQGPMAEKARERLRAVKSAAGG